MSSPRSLPESPPIPGSPPESDLLRAQFRQQMGHISRQSSVFFIGMIFTAAAGYFFKVYLARVLGAEALGIYALGMTMVGFLSVFGGLGLPQSAVRFVSAYSATGEAKLLGGFIVRGIFVVLIANLLLGAVLMVAGRWVAVHFYHTPALSRYLGLFALIMIFGAMNLFFGQILVGYRNVAKRTVIMNFVSTPLMMVLTVGLVAVGFGLRGYIVALVGAAVVAMVLLVIMAWKLTPSAVRRALAKPARLQKEVLTFSAVSFVLVFLQFFMGQTDRVLLGYYLSARQVGIYAIAMALVVFVPAILQSVNQIFAPTISDLHARGNHELLRRIFQTLTKWILGLTIPLAAMMLVFAHPLMRIFGPDFEVGWIVLVIGTLGQLVNCGVGSVGNLLYMSGNERRLIRIHAVAAALMVVLNVLLIPRWGIAGAAVGSAATTTVMNLWTLVDARRVLGLFPFTRSYLRLLPPVAAAMLVLWLAHSALVVVQPAWGVMGAGLVLAYVAFLGVAVLVGLDADDRLIASAVWLRMRSAFSRNGVNS
jgi:O-antigen/teichoic acid export membrane protein